MKPLVVFDLETSGLNKEKDHIIQFSGIRWDPSTNKVLDSLNLYIQPIGDYTITIQAWIKHRITPEMLADKPYLYQVADKIIDFFGSPEDYGILTYNGNRFDIPFLTYHLRKLGKDIDFVGREIYDSYVEERSRHMMDLPSTFFRYYGETMEDKGLKAHDALSDVKATIGIFKAQYADQAFNPTPLLTDDGMLSILDFNGVDTVCFACGKYVNLGVEFISKFDPDYIRWCLLPSTNLSEQTKKVIRKEIQETIPDLCVQLKS